MLVDIFSCFDDNNQVFMNFYLFMWFFAFLSLTLVSSFFWLAPGSYCPEEKIIITIMPEELYRSKGANLGGFNLTLCGLFIFLLMLNFVGLVPNVFSPSSHLIFTLTFGFSVWLALIISGLINNPISFAAALLPAGAPAGLAPFLVVIETISVSVRPMTLSVRLMANMSAGHIVLTLVGNYLSSAMIAIDTTGLILLSIQVFYTMFEFAISFIQAYIFCLLLTLYADEHM